MSGLLMPLWKSRKGGKMNNLDYKKVRTAQEALREASPGSAFIAGGTNIIDLLKYFVTTADRLIDINHLDEKEFYSIGQNEDGGVRLGALAKNAETAYHPLIENQYPLLSRAILAGASAQIRNMATNGGNLLQRTRCYYFYDINTPCNKREPGTGCSAIAGYNRIMGILGTSEHCIAVFPSDMCVALAALEAVVNVIGPEGERKIPFGEFHRLPGDTPEMDNNLKPSEVITSIDLPKQGFNSHYSYLKLRDRHSYVFALVSVATGLQLEDGIIKEARIALGGVAHKPWRIQEAEAYLKEREPVQEHFAEAAAIILKGATPYRFNGFKVE